jgi:uncharacterized membrane protein (UPF0127 family)
MISPGGHERMSALQKSGRLIGMLVSVFFLYQEPVSAAGVRGFDQTQIQLETQHGQRLDFSVFLALSQQQQALGLMHVDQLPARQGMLFVYQHVRPISMWMKNTLLPLDMLFIRADGTIARIQKNTEPYSLESISSIEPALGVLELNAGTCDELGIQVGDVVISPYFGND